MSADNLPRPIAPEDVRVGMVIERRKGEHYVGGRVRGISSSDIWLNDSGVAWIFGVHHAERGWSLWLIEDAPAPVDPDTAAVNALRVAYLHALRGSIDEALSETVLKHLRAQGFDVTPRAEQ